MRTKKHLVTVAALVLIGATTLTGCSKINKNAELATIFDGEDKETITLGFGNFVAKYNQALYDQTYLSYFGEDMWTQDLYGQGSTFQEDVKTQVLEQIEEGYIAQAHASEYDIELTDDEKAGIKKAAADFMDNNSKEAIKQMGATEEYVTTMLTIETYATKMQAAIEAEADDAVTKEEAAQRTFSYVEFNTQTKYDTDGSTVAVTEDEVAEMKTQADTLAASSDFDATVESLGLSASTYSYGTDEDYGTLDESIFKAADALTAGQVSSVIEVEDKGYYVVRLDSEYDEEATNEKMDSLAADKRTNHYNDIMDGWKEDANWTVKDKEWAKVEFKDLFERVQSTETTTDDTTETTTDDTTSEDTTEDTTSEDTTTDSAE